ncbi:MAG: hypothetical protein IJT25_03405 [Clostridia bacterium]|nr:hypothetical protein [Clostridia bacterium]
MTKKKQTINLYYCLAVVLSLVAICMIFVPNVKIVGTLSDAVHYTGNGISTVFGMKDGSLSVFSFSVLSLLTYLLPLCALILMALKMAKVSKSNLLDIISIVLLVVSAVFFFIAPSFAISEYANTLGSLASKKLAIGAILGGVFSALSAVILCLNLVLKKK